MQAHFLIVLNAFNFSYICGIKLGFFEEPPFLQLSQVSRPASFPAKLNGTFVPHSNLVLQNQQKESIHNFDS